MEMQKDESTENEIWCALCRHKEVAVWQVVTGEDELYVCDNHHFELKKFNIVGLERKVGEVEWREVPDIKKQDNL